MSMQASTINRWFLNPVSWVLAKGRFSLALIAHQINRKTSLFLRDQEDRMLLLQRIYHQRGVPIMTQEVFAFQYEVEKKRGGLTALAGLPTYLEFGYVMGLNRAMENRLKIRSGEPPLPWEALGAPRSRL